MFSLQDKVALVTGASRGLGWAIAQSLAQAGALVLLNGRDAASLQARQAELERRGLRSEALAFDVTDHGACTECVGAAAERHGRLDILAANAGINQRGAITEQPVAEFRSVLETNLVGVWALMKEAARIMIPRRAGRIVVTGSMAANIARPTLSAYIASKGAVHALVREAAIELGPHGITVNAIAPGYFATELNTALKANEEFNAWICKRTPVGRWGNAEEIGAAAVYLASDEAAYVNGHILAVDGGFSAAM
jgi:gluconate 5-dehydrogenase